MASKQSNDEDLAKRKMQEIEDRALAQAFAILQREEIYRQLRSPTRSEEYYALAKKRQEEEDRNFAQAIADSQRREIYGQRRQSTNNPLFWSRHSPQQLPRRYLSAAHRQQRQHEMSNFLHSSYWSTYTQKFQPTPYCRPVSAYCRQRTAESTSVRPQKQPKILVEIQGSPAVTHQLVNKYTDSCKKDCENCRHTMQKARVIVTEVDECYRKSFEMTCYAEHFSLVFWSGDRENKMVVQMVAGEVQVSVTKESWKKWLKRVVNKCWSSFKNIVQKGFDMLKALGPVAAITGCVCVALPW